MRLVNKDGLEEISSLVLAFNALVRVDTEYTKNPSQELLNESINIASQVQEGLHKYDMSLQQLAELAGYTPRNGKE